jgi:type I restriction enzyme S subunit
MVRVSDIAQDGDGFAIGPFGSRMKADNYVEQGVAVVRGNNLGAAGTLEGEFVYVPEEVADGLLTCEVREGDVLFPHRGAIGRVGVVPKLDGRRMILSSSMMRLRCRREMALPRYVFYWFSSANGQNEILKYASTVGTPGIGQPLASLREMKLPLPSLDEQRATAGVLGAMDDKIASNRRMISCLVKLAQTLLAVGSKSVRVGDVATIEKGLSYKGSGLSDDRSSTPMFNLGNFNSSGWLDQSATKHYSGAYKDRHVVRAGDLIVANTDLTQQRVILGRPALVPPIAGEAIFTHHVFSVRCDDDAVRLGLWAQLNLSEFRERAEGFATGTTVASMPPDALVDFRMKVPDIEMLNSARPLLERAWVAEAESRVLTTVRDALLPELLSGRLRVRDVDGVLEESL